MKPNRKVISEGSRYFSASRTQPFVITLISAVMAFKKVARLIHSRNRIRKLKTKIRSYTGSAGLKSIIHASDTGLIIAREGGESLKLPNNIDFSKLKEAPKKYNYYEDPTVLAILARKEKDKFKKKKVNYTLLAARHLREHNIKLVKNLIVNVGAKLKEELKSTFIIDTILKAKKNNTIKSIQPDIELEQTNKSENSISGKDGMVMEFLPRTPITYGSNIALQAYHGGYMSLWDPINLKASAHKILPHCKFKILKSNELSFLGNVKYGDAVWLQSTSGLEVLGAFYDMKLRNNSDDPNGGRIRPAVISCRKSHVFKAQQYGRWILLNQEDPIGKLGQQVGHLDKLILEQEWYYLSSQTPYTSGMFKIKEDIDDALNSGLDLFYPAPECTWKFHLVDLPDSNNEEDIHSNQILFNAMNQITSSKKRRMIKSQELLCPLSKKIPERMAADSIVKNQLLHKLIPDENTRHLVQKFEDLSKKNFTNVKGSKDFIKKIYGANSPVYLYMVFVESMKAYHEYGEGKLPIFVKTIADQLDTQKPGDDILEKAENYYWIKAQRVLTNTLAWNELTRAMKKYHELDAEKKLRSIKIIQKFFKKCLDLKFSWARNMRLTDVALSEKELQRMNRIKLFGEDFDSTSEKKQGDENSDDNNNNILTTSFSLANNSSDVNEEIDPTINRSRSRSMSQDYYQDYDIYSQSDTNLPQNTTTGKVQVEKSSRKNLKLTMPVQGYMSPVAIPANSPMSTKRNIRPNTSYSPTKDKSFFTTQGSSGRGGSPTRSSSPSNPRPQSKGFFARSYSAPTGSFAEPSIESDTNIGSLVIGYPSIISENMMLNMSQTSVKRNSIIATDSIKRQASFDSNISVKTSMNNMKRKMLKLPSDVVENEIIKTNLSADTGMKFLRAISSKSLSKVGMFDEIIVKKKPFTSSSIL